MARVAVIVFGVGGASTWSNGSFIWSNTTYSM